MTTLLRLSLCLIAVHNNMANVLEITPMPFIPTLTSKMTLTCRLSPMYVAVTQVIAIQLQKRDGDQETILANLQAGNSPVLKAASLIPRAKVEGELEQTNLKDAYLTMTIAHPQSVDQGQYTCAITAVDKTDVMHTLVFKANSSAETITSSPYLTTVTAIQTELQTLQGQIPSLLANDSSLLSRITWLEEEVKHRTAQLVAMETKQNATLDELNKLRSEIDPSSLACPVTCSDKIVNLWSNLTSASRQLEKFTGDLTSLNATLNGQTGHQHRHSVAFSARYKAHPSGLVNVQPPAVLIFKDVLVNIGGAYDSTLGSFTAPTSGTYVFFLNVPIRGNSTDRAFHVALLDKSRTISQIEKGIDKPTTSLSVIYNLLKGDVVYSYVQQVSGPDPTPNLSISVYAAYFAGFLLY